jgi:transposase-like protein
MLLDLTWVLIGVRFLCMMNFNELMASFPDENSCRQYLTERRWPNGKVTCPRCGNEKVWALKSRPFHWQCQKCGKTGYRFSVIAGTIFENTNYPLLTWFRVLWTMLESKKGVSSRQLGRMFFGKTSSTRTPWYMSHRLRGAMHDPDFRQLMGVVEVDETAIGGKDKNRHWDKKQHITGMSGKTTVIGAISRKGNVVCQIIENTNAATLNRFVRKAVSDRVSLVATDDFGGYHYLTALGFKHDSVKHSENEYVRGEIHTNNIESFWALLKRGIVGTYHHVSKKYLPLYLAEFQFRHNNRKNEDIFGAAIAGC